MVLYHGCTADQVNQYPLGRDPDISICKASRDSSMQTRLEPLIFRKLMLYQSCRSLFLMLKYQISCITWILSVPVVYKKQDRAGACTSFSSLGNGSCSRTLHSSCFAFPHLKVSKAVLFGSHFLWPTLGLLNLVKFHFWKLWYWARSSNHVIFPIIHLE